MGRLEHAGGQPGQGHGAAETGQLSQIPRERLTTDLLLTRNDNGDTPLHAAAYEGHLDQIPPSLFTPDLLAVRNYDGVAVGRVAVTRGFAGQLPTDVRPKPPAWSAAPSSASASPGRGIEQSFQRSAVSGQLSEAVCLSSGSFSVRELTADS